MRTSSRSRACRRTTPMLLAAATLCACTGVIDGAGAPDEGPAGPPRSGATQPTRGAPGAPGAGAVPGSPTGQPSVAAPVGPGAPASTCVASPGPRPLRRLTNTEYENTVRDLFPGFSVPPLASQLPGDNVRRFFDNNASAQVVLQAQAEGFSRTAEAVSGAVTAEVPKLLGCDTAARGEETCAIELLRGLAARAFRRPVADDEGQRLAAAYKDARTKLDLRGALQAGIERILQSPQFLYRLEGLGPGQPAASGALGPYEIAASLSYLLWGTMPDAALFQAAASGTLSNLATVRSQAERLLKGPRAKASVLHFFRQWLDLAEVGEISRSPELFKGFSPDIAHAMLRELETFVAHVGLDATVKYDALLTATHSFQNKALAAFLGRTGGATAFDRVALDPARHAGILTASGLLALNSTAEDSSPIFRGRFVRERLLCDELPPPPPGVPDLPEIKGDKTVREIHELHASAPQCAPCHQLLDPIGYGLENFDAVGRWRDSYKNGKPVDARGSIVGGDGAEGAFSGAVELGARLGKSSKVRHCLAENALRFALGRDLGAADECAVGQLSSLLGAAAGGRFQDVLLAIATSDALLRRSR